MLDEVEIACTELSRNIPVFGYVFDDMGCPTCRERLSIYQINDLAIVSALVIDPILK